MQWFSFPAHQYEKFMNSKRVKKFTKVSINTQQGFQNAVIFLRVPLIDDTPLYYSDPGYQTELVTFFPFYLAETVMCGYLIFKHSGLYSKVTDDKYIVKKPDCECKTYKRSGVFKSKILLLMEGECVNFFIPCLKYSDTTLDG